MRDRRSLCSALLFFGCSASRAADATSFFFVFHGAFSLPLSSSYTMKN
jgi:hypothetical protein